MSDGRSGDHTKGGHPRCRELARTLKDINEQLSRAVASMQKGTSLPGMCYEEGVIAALDWILGNVDDEPMESEP